jgi:hypothetical protein
MLGCKDVRMLGCKDVGMLGCKDDGMLGCWEENVKKCRGIIGLKKKPADKGFLGRLWFFKGVIG